MSLNRLTQISNNLHTQSFDELVRKSLKRNPQTEIDLCLYTPSQTLFALKRNEKIQKWHKYILKTYKPKNCDILLLFSCAASKPWMEGITKSKNYQILYELLKTLKIRNKISLHTISEPLAIIGEKDYENMPIYDNPGLFRWFVNNNDLNWDQNAYDECINILGSILGKFIEKFDYKFKNIIGFVKPNSNHFKILSIARTLTNSNIIIGPTKKEIGKLRNNYSWMSNKNVNCLFKKYIAQIIS